MLTNLSSKKTVLLFIHLTLGQYILYPLVFSLLIKSFQINTLIDTYLSNLFLDTLMISSTLYLAFDFYKVAFKRFRAAIVIHTLSVLKLIPVLFITSFILNSFAYSITQQSGSHNQQILIELLKENQVFIIFQALIYAPILEELLFRGYFYGLFEKKNKWAAMFISGLLFGCAHMWTTSFTLSDLAFLPAYSSLGIIIAYSYAQSKSIVSPMLLHFFNNLIGILALMML